MSLSEKLLFHPASAGQHAVDAIFVQVACLPNLGLCLKFLLTGDLSQVCLPAPGPAMRADRLWQHSCFEAFLRQGGAQAYLELNFSPSGQWAAYAFDAYREPSAGTLELPAPETTMQQTTDALELLAVVYLDSLFPRGTRLELGLSAVIESSDGDLSYWSLIHPDERPDFHHPESFRMSLALDEAAHS